MAPAGVYHGRLQTDGYGNLLADNPDDPEVHGQPVAYHEGSYIFLGPGESSHNTRHEQNVVTMDGTVDSSMNDDESLVNAGGGENMHHFETQEDDAHYDENAPNKTKAPLDPDATAAKVTGHTDAWGGTE